MTSKKTEIPLYTKIGIRVTVVLMLVIGFLLIRNCSSSVYYSVTTPATTISDAYEKGVADGRVQAAGKTLPHPFVEKNPALKKAYQRGFRAGWDAERSSLPNTLSPTSKEAPTSPTAPDTTTASDREGK
jgi:hypothetical protein